MSNVKDLADQWRKEAIKAHQAGYETAELLHSLHATQLEQALEKDEAGTYDKAPDKETE